MHIESYTFNMQYTYVPRKLTRDLSQALARFPAVAILGPRQCGKSTLAKAFLGRRRGTLYLDLERRSDTMKLRDPELFFEAHPSEIVCLDEVQRLPEIFTSLRSVIDERGRAGQFIILGSASRELMKQSSESLAGRIAYLELTPFLFSELVQSGTWLSRYLARGGYPPSALAASESASFLWRQSFIRTFLERDVPQLDVRIPAATLDRLWRMCAHQHGQLLNQSRLGAALGVSHTTIRSYIDLLVRTFMLRTLPPLMPNLKKRLVKSPKIYIRDSGILHALLDVETYDDLLGHPAMGASWEGLVIENILSEMPGWKGYFYRTASGAEIDLVLERGRRRLAIECKASASPEPSAGFWTALDDLEIADAWIVGLVGESYPLKRGVNVASLKDCVRALK
jgi:predicted AAA+ superfamily ATPase